MVRSMETAREKVKLGEWKLRKYKSRKKIIKDDEQSAGYFWLSKMRHAFTDIR